MLASINEAMQTAYFAATVNRAEIMISLNRLSLLNQLSFVYGVWHLVTVWDIIIYLQTSIVPIYEK